MKYSILLTNNNRSKSYLQNLIKIGFIPEFAIVLDNVEFRPENTLADMQQNSDSKQVSIQKSADTGFEFDDKEHILTTLKKHKVNYVLLPTLEVNSEQVIQLVKQSPTKYILYSGAGGAILKKEILSQGKLFIHAHPGWLPEFRGSTTFYYSMLINQEVACSVFIMNEKIDAGKLLVRKRFLIKEKNIDYDRVLDPCVRTATLLEFFSNSEQYLKNEIKINADKANNFYIIHPVLKHLAILGIKN